MTGPNDRHAPTELLRLVGIAPDRLNSYPHELSGGMRQRAIIAIALALNPEVIIMDEPTTALDVVVQRDILLEIAGIARGVRLLRDLYHARPLAAARNSRQVAIMYAGRIVETGHQRELKRHAAPSL